MIFFLDVKGEPVDKLDGGGRTPLHFACGWGHVDVVAELVKRGCALEARPGCTQQRSPRGSKARHPGFFQYFLHLMKEKLAFNLNHYLVS